MDKRELLKGLISGEISLNDSGKLYLFHYITYLNGYPIKEDTFCSDIDGPITEKDRIDSQRCEKLGAANAQLTASGVMSFCYPGISNFENAKDLQKWQPLFASTAIYGLNNGPGWSYSEIIPSTSRSTAVILEEEIGRAHV